MKVKDLRDMYKKQEEKLTVKMPFDTDEVIQIKPFVSSAEKISTINTLIASTMDMETGVLDKHFYNIALTNKKIELHTDIRLPKDMFEAYDLIIGLELDTLLENLPKSEIDMWDKIEADMIESIIPKYAQPQNIATVVDKFLTNMETKLPSASYTEKFIDRLSMDEE